MLDGSDAEAEGQRLQVGGGAAELVEQGLWGEAGGRRGPSRLWSWPALELTSTGEDLALVRLMEQGDRLFLSALPTPPHPCSFFSSLCLFFSVSRHISVDQFKKKDKKPPKAEWHPSLQTPPCHPSKDPGPSEEQGQMWLKRKMLVGNLQPVTNEPDALASPPGFSPWLRVS